MFDDTGQLGKDIHDSLVTYREENVESKEVNAKESRE
jgi:hypothetical protein